jgi:hypothetical protein
MRENRIFAAKSTEKDKKRKDLPLKTAIFTPITFRDKELKRKIHCKDREASRNWYRIHSYTPDFCFPPSSVFILASDNDKKRRHCCLLIITLYEFDLN